MYARSKALWYAVWPLAFTWKRATIHPDAPAIHGQIGRCGVTDTPYRRCRSSLNVRKWPPMNPMVCSTFPLLCGL